mgnify:CR=1 FL=1
MVREDGKGSVRFWYRLGIFFVCCVLEREKEWSCTGILKRECSFLEAKHRCRGSAVLALLLLLVGTGENARDPHGCQKGVGGAAVGLETRVTRGRDRTVALKLLCCSAAS